MTISACYNAYHFMVTADSSCTENCLKFDSEETENMEDFTSTDGGHILLETGNSAWNIHLNGTSLNFCKLQIAH